MNETSIVLILFGSFIGLLMLGAPVMVSLGLAALASFLYLDENPIKLVQIAFNAVGSFPLMALPAFILAGALMEASGISKRLVNLAESFAGPVTGGISAAARAGLHVLRCHLRFRPGHHRRGGDADDSGHDPARL